MRKILIIKLGYSETADPEVGKVSSLGDVLRTTVLLHLYKNDIVTWLTDIASVPLLKGNPYITEILDYDLSNVLQLMCEEFDTVINLEKVKGLAALASRIRSRQKFGFWFDRKTGLVEPHDGCEYVFSMCKDVETKKNNDKKWQQLLFDIVGAKWNGEGYVLGYKPNNFTPLPKTVIGLNHKVGSKWPNKEWHKWAELQVGLMCLGYIVLWQKGDTLESYMDWINSCDIIISSDSLGVHIALALNKKVLILCGPTNCKEIGLYGKSEVLYAAYNTCEYRPCQSAICHLTPDSSQALCMEFIQVNEVISALGNFGAALQDKLDDKEMPNG